MRAHHHDLILQIGARNFRDGVIGHRVVVMKLYFQVRGNLEALVALNHVNQAVVIFDSQRDLRGNVRRAGGPDSGTR